MNQFKLVHQKHITVAEWPNVYTVYLRYILYVGFSCVVDLKFISSHTLKNEIFFLGCHKVLHTRFYNLESIGRNLKVFRTWSECRNSRDLFSLFILYDYEFELV